VNLGRKSEIFLNSVFLRSRDLLLALAPAPRLRKSGFDLTKGSPADVTLSALERKRACVRGQLPGI